MRQSPRTQGASSSRAFSSPLTQTRSLRRQVCCFSQFPSSSLVRSCRSPAVPSPPPPPPKKKSLMQLSLLGWWERDLCWVRRHVTEGTVACMIFLCHCNRSADPTHSAFKRKKKIICLAAPVLSCSSGDLHLVFWHVRSLVVACELLFVVCGI